PELPGRAGGFPQRARGPGRALPGATRCCGSRGRAPHPSRHAAAAPGTGGRSMKRLLISTMAVATALGAGACRKQEPKAAEGHAQPSGGRAGDMSAMPGMAGMPMQADSGAIPIDRTRAGRLGVTFARAAKRPLERRVRLTGTLAYAEPRREYVNARVTGWIEGLRADYVGRPVRKGDVLLSIYAPDLLSAQEEYLSAQRLGDSSL